MASHPAYADHRDTETTSGAFFKAAAVLLGFAVGVFGFVALMMWADARDARDEGTRPGGRAAGGPAARDGATPQQLRRRLPPNAQALAEAHKAYDATLPPAPAGDVAKVHMTLKDMTVQIAPGVKYNTWSFSGHGAPGPILHVRQGQMVEMTLTNGGAIPHSIDFHAARIAPNIAFRDVNPGESFTFRFRADDPGVFMYHCGTKPVLTHIANGMYGAIVVSPDEAAPEGRQGVRARRQRVVHDDRRDQAAGLASTWPRRTRWSPTGRRSTATRTSTSRTR